jgi:hypothetical protein
MVIGLWAIRRILIQQGSSCRWSFQVEVGLIVFNLKKENAETMLSCCWRGYFICGQRAGQFMHDKHAIVRIMICFINHLKVSQNFSESLKRHEGNTATACYKSAFYSSHDTYLHASTTVNPNDLSINPFAVLASKEANRPRNIDREADSM